jgi:ADP-heptose:LPS heptosyltransferase
MIYSQRPLRNTRTTTTHKIQQQVGLDQAIKSVNAATEYLNNSGKSPKILVKIAKNMGDSMHGQPIIRHYRHLHPNAAIVYMVEDKYRNVHEYDTNIDQIVSLPNGLDNKVRLALWDPIKSNKNIDIAIVPAINPFQALHKENAWCHKNIADQYFHNAGIPNLQPLGGRHIEVKYDMQDKAVADKLLAERGEKLIAVEYISYSTAPIWKMSTYTAFVQLAAQRGFKCLSIAGKHEPLIPGTIDCRGITWRQTAALLSKVQYVIGCGSGITVLAAAARPQPKILELDIPENVTIAGCGYAPGILIKKPTPQSVIEMVVR